MKSCLLNGVFFVRKRIKVVTATELRQASASIRQQQTDISKATKDLQARQRRLTTARAVREIPRQQRQLAQRQIGGVQQQLARGTEQLTSTQKQLQSIGKQLQQQEIARNRIDKINRIIKRSFAKGSVGGEFSELSRSDRNLVIGTISALENRNERNAIRNIESQLKQSLPASSRANILAQIRLGKTQINIPLINGGQTQLIQLPPQISKQLFTPIPTPTRLPAITPAPSLTGLNKQIFNVEKQLFQLERKPISQRTTSEKLKITGLQGKLDVLSVAKAGITPIKTVKRIGKVIKEVGKFAVSPETVETPLAGISTALRTRPEATALTFATIGVGAIGIPINIGKINKLTSLSRLKAFKKPFIVEKPKPGFKKTPLSKTFPEEVKLGIDDKQVVSFLKNEFNKQGGNFGSLTKVDQEFLIGQVKARIRNNPQLFIPKVRQEALKRAGVTNIKDFTLRRLEGDFPQLVLREKLKTKDLTDLQKRTLGAITENLEKERIARAIKTGPAPIKPSQLLSPTEKAFILKQFEAQIRARKLDLTPAQRRLLEQINTKSELARVRKAILEGRKPISPEDFLTTFEKNNIVEQIRAQVRSNPKLRLTTAQRIALQRAETKAQLDRVRRAIEKGSDDILPKDLISEFERKRIETQLGAQARAGEFRAFGKKQVQIQVQKPVVEIKTGQLSSAQQALLRRLKESTTAKAKAVQEVRRAREVAVPKPEALKALQRTNQQQKLVQKQIQLEGQKLRKAQNSRQAFVKTQQATLVRLQARQQSLNRLRVPLASVQRTQLLSQIQQQRQVVVQAQRFAQKQAFQFESFFSAVAQAQGIAQPQRFAQRVAQREGLALKRKRLLIPRLFKIPKTGLLKQSKKTLKEKTQAYNAFARPQGSKKLMKLNTKPLSKSKAKDTMAWFVDNSLSATGAIRKTKGKIQKSRLGIPSNYGENTKSKFREYKIRKGQPIFTKDKFIERRNRRLDTIRERKNIKLAALVARKRKAISKRILPPKFKSTFGKKKKKK